MSWTPEKVEKLKELWGKGNTASEIAQILGGVTRNAVIGKAHRLNLSGKIQTKKGKKSKDLIVEISGKNNIISFNQRIPNMNDIFIMKVNKEKNG